MSYTFVICIALFGAAIGAGAVFLVLRHSLRRLAVLASGQRLWREIALCHSATIKELKYNADRLRMELEQACDLIDATEAQLESIVVFLWGAPPLDRTAKDVILAITELREAASDSTGAAIGLYYIIARQDADIKRMLQESMDAKQANKAP